MRAQPTGARDGRRIDQTGDFGPRRRVGEVVALGEEQLPALVRGHDEIVDVDAAQTRGVDERLGRNGRRGRGRGCRRR